MNWFDGLKTQAKLNLSLALLCALLVGVSAFAVRQLAAVNGSTVEIAAKWMPSVRYCWMLNTNFSDHRIILMRYLLASDAAELAAQDRRIADIEAEIARNRRTYEALISSPDERARYEQFAASVTEYLQVHGRVVALVRQGRVAEASVLMKTESFRSYDASTNKLIELINLNDRGAAAATAGAASGYARSRTGLFGVVAVGVALTALLAFLLSRGIIGSINRGVTVLARVSEGLSSASTQLSAAAAEISSGAQEQASGLEETASSLEEITSTVKQNADSAQQASQLAASAREVAERGGQIVCDAVGAMGEINRSSNQIADIITTIDEIAFQTNLLALNAAVEAARAGEQGRGFAVVAAEVRTLALRSAAASKEIKGLIKDSVGKVEAGSTLVTQSGTTLREIITAVKRVTDVVAEIAAATREQATGIDQVNRAVAQMDGVTQSNASQTEEMAGTAESLSGQADELQQVVEQMSREHGLDVVTARRSGRAAAPKPTAVHRARAALRAAVAPRSAPRAETPAKAELPVDLDAADALALGNPAFEEF
jgi:methyl-accepting chemotaxis protein